MYVRVNPDDIQASEAVILVPIADEGGLIDLIKSQANLTFHGQGLRRRLQGRRVRLPLPVYFLFADKYAYISLR